MKQLSILVTILFLSKTTLNAQIKLWSHHTGDTSVNGDYANEIRFDNNGNSVVCGAFHGTISLDPNNIANTLTSNGSSDAYIAKYDVGGNLLFQKKITGPSYETIYAMDLDNNGNIFVTGTFASSMDLDPSTAVATFTSYGNSSDIFIAKYDANGNYIWGKSIGSVGNTDNGLELCLDNNGSVIVTGHFTGSVSFATGIATASKTALGGMDAYVVKYDSAGVFKWVNTIGSAPHWERGKKIVCDANNNIYVAGEFSSVIDIDPSATVLNITPIAGANNNYFIAKYNTNGLPQWGKAMPVEPNICTHNNAIYLAAYAKDSMDYDLDNGTYYLPTSSYYKMFVAKYNTNMQLIWAKQFQDSSYSLVSNIQFNNQQNIIISGEFNNYGGSIFDFDLSANNYILNTDTIGLYDYFVAQYDSNLNFKNAFALNQTKYGFITSQDVDANNNVAICGYFQDTLFLDPLSPTTMAISKGEWDLFAGKYAFAAPTATSSIIKNNSIVVYPNPVTDVLNINNTQSLPYTIYNNFGQNVACGFCTNKLQVSTLPSGIYFLQLGIHKIKFTKQ